MPIVNCTLAPDCKIETNNIQLLIEKWFEKARLPGAASEMTVNCIKSEIQLGKCYKIIARLYLPTLWSVDEINSLQIGLHSALQECFLLHAREVLVLTILVESGRVVDGEGVVAW